MDNSNQNPSINALSQAGVNEGIIPDIAATNSSPFDAEDEAIKKEEEARLAAEKQKDAILQTVLSGLRVDRFRRKKCAKFTPSVLGPAYSNIAMEQIPDGGLSFAHKTRYKLSIAMGYTHTENTENIALCAVKLPVGTTIHQLEAALKALVGEDNYLTKDYLRTANTDHRDQFRKTVEDLRFISTVNECANAANADPYGIYLNQANSILDTEENSLS